jgi:DNA-directed RNA polymerase sigma subunit (sigma70/sigma32)
MAAQKDLLSRLADAGEEAIQRLSKAPGGDNIAKALNVSRERLDELQKRVRGIEALEKRVAALEKRVDALSQQARPAGKKAAAKKPAARKPRASATSPAPNPGP